MSQASSHNALLLKLSELQTWFSTRHGAARAVDGVSLEIRKGETFALLGESGCGKSITALSIMQLLPEVQLDRLRGEILLDGESLLDLPEREMRKIRGRRISMIFQEPMTSLNPVLSVGDQVGEVLHHHFGITGVEQRKRVIELLGDVGLPDPAERIDAYPHQLSGGMKQRVMIAIALAAEPDLLIADEPTTALDVTIQAQILELLRRLQKERGMAILLITHDLGVVAEMADRVAVMYAGQLIEQAPREPFFANPSHPYTRRLFDAIPDSRKRSQPLSMLHGTVPVLTQEFRGCRFHNRCDRGWDLCAESSPRWFPTSKGQAVRCHLFDPELEQIDKESRGAQSAAEPYHSVKNSDNASSLLQVEGLKVHFPVKKGFFHRTAGHVKAVDGVDLSISAGRTVALVGESGCGKTTVGKSILRLLDATEGTITFDQVDLRSLEGDELRKIRSDFQMIFQDPYASMNPRMMVADIIGEGMDSLLGESSQQRVGELLEEVGLAADMAGRYPHEFSGGQRQRIAIARALAVNPRLIVCDEPTSALDVSVQAQILNLLRRLQQQQGISYLFITHNLSVVSWFAQEVAVMYLGKIVEYGTVEEVMTQPLHPYTQALLSAVPLIEKESGREVIRLEGDQASSTNPPLGCPFHPRCPQAVARCSSEVPVHRKIDERHRVSCLLVDEIT